jgi:hypothetical protein
MKKITPQTMKAIVDLWCCDKELAPEGQFYCLENNVWVACDNSTGDCWVEEFETENGAIGWLEDDNVCGVNNYSLSEEV